MLLDPFLFNYFLLLLYGLNGAQFLVRGYWLDSLYWFCALGITVAVTFRR